MHNVWFTWLLRSLSERLRQHIDTTVTTKPPGQLLAVHSIRSSAGLTTSLCHYESRFSPWPCRYCCFHCCGNDQCRFFFSLVTIAPAATDMLSRKPQQTSRNRDRTCSSQFSVFPLGAVRFSGVANIMIRWQERNQSLYCSMYRSGVARLTYSVIKNNHLKWKATKNGVCHFLFFLRYWSRRIPLAKRLLSMLLYSESLFVKQRPFSMCVRWHKTDIAQDTFFFLYMLFLLILGGGGVYRRAASRT